MKRSTKNIIKWVIYSLMLYVLLVLQTTPGLFEIKGVKPMLILPLAVFVAVFEGEKGGLFFAIATGILTDLASDKILGFTSIILSVCCIAIALLTIFLVRATLINCCVLCTVTLSIYCLLDYLFYYLIWGYSGTFAILLRHYLPMVVYSAIISPLIFIAVKAVASKYNEILRV